MISFILSTNNYKNSLDDLLSEFTPIDPSTYEIIVVDQSNDNTILEACEKKLNLNLRYFKNDEIGLSKGRNFGLKFAKGRYLMFPDDDAFIRSCELKLIIEIIEFISPDLALFGVFKKDSDMRLSYCKYHESKFINLNQIVKYSTSINICIKNSEKIKLFDNDFGLGGIYNSSEEHEFLMKNIKSIHRVIYLDNIRIEHPDIKTLNISDLYYKVRKNTIGQIELVYRYNDYFIKSLAFNFLLKNFLRLLLLKNFKSNIIILYASISAIIDWIKLKY